MTGSPTILEVEMTGFPYRFPYRLQVEWERNMIRDDSKVLGLGPKLEDGVALYWMQRMTKASLERAGSDILF